MRFKEGSLTGLEGGVMRAVTESGGFRPARLRPVEEGVSWDFGELPSKR
jgi:hypothetical protein